jgi:hypothetical protein
MEKKIEKKEDTLTPKEVCSTLKVNINSRKYIEHKYRNQEMTLKEWKSNLKKDGLSF